MIILIAAAAGLSGLFLGLGIYSSVQKKRFSTYLHVWQKKPIVPIRFGFQKKTSLEKAVRSLPDLFDLLGLALGAGLDLAGAFKAVAPQISNPHLRGLVAPLLTELRLSLPREEIFTHLQKRLAGTSGFATIGLLNQALQHGFPLSATLKNQADHLRRTRQIQLEKKAQTIGLRLLLPIGVFIFPAMLLLIFGGLSLMVSQEGSWLNW